MVTELYLSEVQKHLEKIEMDTALLDSKQLCQFLNLSWPTIEKLFLNDPKFPKIRVGKNGFLIGEKLNTTLTDGLLKLDKKVEQSNYKPTE